MSEAIRLAKNLNMNTVAEGVEEKAQVEFQRIKEQFYEEVVYADKGPGPEE